MKVAGFEWRQIKNQSIFQSDLPCRNPGWLGDARATYRETIVWRNTDSLLDWFINVYGPIELFAAADWPNSEAPCGWSQAKLICACPHAHANWFDSTHRYLQNCRTYLFFFCFFFILSFLFYLYCYSRYFFSNI